MNHPAIARGIAAVGLPALLLAFSGAPALAAEKSSDDKGKPDKVYVTVCKEVKDGDKTKGDKDDEKKQKFSFTVETDKTKKSFDLKDGQCKYDVKLKYEDAKVKVSEDKVYGYKVKDIYVYGDVKKTTKDDNKVVIKFKDNKDEPKLYVKFVNEKKDKKEH